MRAISRFLKRAAVKYRQAGRKKFQKGGSKNRLGSFDTDKFYGKKTKVSMTKAAGAGGAAGAAAGVGYGDAKKPTPETRRRVNSLVRSNQAPSRLKDDLNHPRASNKGMKKLANRYESESKDLAKLGKERDADYVNQELKKETELRQKRINKERKRIAKTNPGVQKELKDFVEGKKSADWEKKNWGALTGSEKRKMKRLAKPGESPQQAHKRASTSERQRKKTRSRNVKEAEINKKTEKVLSKKKNQGISRANARSQAVRKIDQKKAAANQANQVKAPGKTRPIGETGDTQVSINRRNKIPDQGSARLKAGKRTGGHKFDPGAKKRNTKKVLDSQGKVKNVQSRARGTGKEEATIAGQAAKRGAIKRAKKLLPKDDELPEGQYPDLKVFKDIMNKVRKPDDGYPRINLEEKKKATVIGSATGAAAGGLLAGNYLRDVKLRHKQLKRAKLKGTKKVWRSGKAPLYSDKAPKGFRRHVGSRALMKLLTPLAIGGGIGYGIDKKRRKD